MRFSVGAVNVRTGNFAYFDTTTASHPARSISWPAARCRPASRPIEIDGEYLLGRRPRIQHAAAMGARQPTRGTTRWPSRSISGAHAARCRATSTEVDVRQKEIQFSSRTRAATDQYKRAQKLRLAVAELIGELQAEQLREHVRQ